MLRRDPKKQDQILTVKTERKRECQGGARKLEGYSESRGKRADLNWEAPRTGQAKACLQLGLEPEPGG
jgi:hypothetical protein